MSRPRRLDGIEYVGFHQYFLTICTHQRRHHFMDDATVALVLAQFLRTAAGAEFEILAYCFMPDHLHLVVVASSEDSDLRRFIGLAKQRSAYLFARVTRERLWQEGYFEHVVRNDEILPELVGYILRNPVRAGLVADPTEYPYWGSQVYSREELKEYVGSVRRG